MSFKSVREFPEFCQHQCIKKYDVEAFPLFSLAYRAPDQLAFA